MKNCDSCGTPIYKKENKIIHVDKYMGDKCDIYNEISKTKTKKEKSQ